MGRGPIRVFVGAGQVLVHNCPVLTDFNGQSLIANIRDLGVEVQQGPETDTYHQLRGGNAVTQIWGRSAADTVVLLPQDASNTAIAEEYLHVLYAQARGWASLSEPESLLEEVDVEGEVLAHAGELGTSSQDIATLQANRQYYINRLATYYGIHV